MAQAQWTTDHELIRRWADERGAAPAAVKGTGGDEDPGIIRLDFPGYSGEGELEPISYTLRRLRGESRARLARIQRRPEMGVLAAAIQTTGG